MMRAAAGAAEEGTMNGDRRATRMTAVVVGLLAMCLVAPASVAAAGSGASPASGLRSAAVEIACEDSAFTCVTLSVPRDHFASAASTESIHVTFAIHRAVGARMGVWVTATGGPGSSGILAADSYMATMDPRIVDAYDIVFFDQRGVGLSEPLACPRAAARFYLSPADARDPRQEPAVLSAARSFAASCVAESGVDPAVLPSFATRQAVEDLEAFRRYLGVDRLDLYGESYGTQFVQTYALAHPDRVRSLILDGPVDLTLPLDEVWPEAVRAMDRTLVRTLDACDADPACRADVTGRTALGAYDSLAARLSRSPARVAFPLASGKSQVRRFWATHLETVALNDMYGQWGRMELQRVIAAASRGNLVPAQRSLAVDVAMDPETLTVTPDPSWSDAAYYAIECADYSMPGPTPDARARAFLEAGRAAGAAAARLGRVMFDDLPCAYWPAGSANDTRPGRIVDHAYPLVVLVADTDPITPIEGAERIVSRAPGARLVVQTGGPHVLYGRGVACVDDIVTALLADGSLPPPRTTCDGDLVDAYLPLPPVSRSAAVDPLAMATAVDDWIAMLPAYAWWDGGDGGAAGCDFGGRFAFAARGDAVELSMRRCALTPRLPLTVAGRVDPTGAVRLVISCDLGTLVYRRSEGGALRVTGTWRGRAVDVRG